MISVIVPCYNSSEFIEDAFKSIARQGVKDLEVIVIDDGSTDDTGNKVKEASATYNFPTKYFYQSNAGSYAARIAGLTHSSGEYIAFYDCDDIWCDHHLSQCWNLLEENPDVDWIYGPVKRISAATGCVVEKNSFYPEGKPFKFLSLGVQRRGDLNVFEDSRVVQYALSDGIEAGLHSSLIRWRVFKLVKMRSDLRNGEDRFYPIRVLKKGFKLGYVLQIQEIYRIHPKNTSAVGAKSTKHKLQVYQNILRGYKDLFSEVDLNQEEKCALQGKISNIQFWNIGHWLLWYNDLYFESLKWMFAGAWTRKYDISKWVCFLGRCAQCIFYVARFK